MTFFITFCLQFVCLLLFEIISVSISAFLFQVNRPKEKRKIIGLLNNRLQIVMFIPINRFKKDKPGSNKSTGNIYLQCLHALQHGKTLFQMVR